MLTHPYGDPFDPATLTADLATLSDVLSRFFASVRADQWQNRTGKHAHDWTLHQALAHITAIAEFFDTAINATIRGQPYAAPAAERGSLGAFNQREIDMRQHIPPADLIASLIGCLARASDSAQHATPDLLACQINLPLY